MDLSSDTMRGTGSDGGPSWATAQAATSTRAQPGGRVSAPLGRVPAGPVPVDTVIAGGWLLTLNAQRDVYRAGAVAIDGGAIVAVGQRDDILARYAPRRLIDAPDGVIMPGLVNGHRHLLCCAKGAMPEGGQTLDALRRFIYPSFAALTDEDMYVHAQHAAAEMIRFGTTLFEEPGCNHLDAVLEALAASGIRARTGPWTWDQAGPTGDTGPAGLAADGRPGRAAPAGRRDRSGAQVRPPADQGRGHHRGRRHLLRRADPGRRRAGRRRGVAVRAAQVDQRA